MATTPLQERSPSTVGKPNASLTPLEQVLQRASLDHDEESLTILVNHLRAERLIFLKKEADGSLKEKTKRAKPPASLADAADLQSLVAGLKPPESPK